MKRGLPAVLQEKRLSHLGRNAIWWRSFESAKEVRVFKDFFDVLSKVKSRALLVVFVALAISTFTPSGGPIHDPWTLDTLALPVLVFMADFLIVTWVLTINYLNSRLPPQDHADWGRALGGSVLAFCLCVTFWYVSNFPDPFSIKLLGSPEFARMAALYLLGVETINTKRYYGRTA